MFWSIVTPIVPSIIKERVDRLFVRTCEHVYMGVGTSIIFLGQCLFCMRFFSFSATNSMVKILNILNILNRVDGSPVPRPLHTARLSPSLLVRKCVYLNLDSGEIGKNVIPSLGRRPQRSPDSKRFKSRVNSFTAAGVKLHLNTPCAVLPVTTFMFHMHLLVVRKPVAGAA